MKMFTIEVPELWIQSYTIEAETIEEAMDKFDRQEMEPDDGPEYSYTLDSSHWTAFEWAEYHPDSTLATGIVRRFENLNRRPIT
jgi:hypothetical protein